MKSVYCFDKNNLLFFNSLFLRSVGIPTTSPLNRFHATFSSSSSALYLLTFFSLSLIHSVLFKLCVFLHFLDSLFASDRNMKKWEKNKNQFSLHAHRRRYRLYKNIFFNNPRNCTFKFDDWVSWALWKFTVTETLCEFTAARIFSTIKSIPFLQFFFRFDFSEQFSIKFLCEFYFMEWINRCTYDCCTCEYGFVHKILLRSRHVHLTTKTALNWIIFVIIGI